jgi:hypothetical protein
MILEICMQKRAELFINKGQSRVLIRYIRKQLSSIDGHFG